METLGEISTPFKDRQDAGKKMAIKAERFRDKPVVVIGIHRGGASIAYEIAQELRAPFDVLVVEKIESDENPEFAMGAVAEDGISWINRKSAQALGVLPDELKALVQSAEVRAKKRAETLRRNIPHCDLSEQWVLLVNDGLDSGASVAAAAKYIRNKNAERIILMTPICPLELSSFYENHVDEVVSLISPKEFGETEFWYNDFSQLSDDEILELLNLQCNKNVLISDPASEVVLRGSLTAPYRDSPNTRGLVIFAHGSGSSRFSPRNRMVADFLNKKGMWTLLFDLLTEDESQDRDKIFDIDLLSQRLVLATEWASRSAEWDSIGYFGASTGAAAALAAAAILGDRISSVVSRGGRPDLVPMEILTQIRAPTLLIVGGRDDIVIELNRGVLQNLTNSNLIVIPGATHLFEEPGALEKVASIAANWFRNSFTRKLKAA